LMTSRDLKKAYSIEVKTTTKNTVFRFGKYAKHTKSDSHVYILVHIKSTKKDGESIMYYVVPSNDLSRLIGRARLNPGGFVARIENLLPFKDKWSTFGKSGLPQSKQPTNRAPQPGSGRRSGDRRRRDRAPSA
jgi:hypothetical protein